MIQLHRLEGFYWVSIHQGYAEAARNFPYPITQPAVHQQVSKLEKELELKLFERVAKDKVVHTAAGGRLFEFCAPFFAELPAVVRALRAESYGGELRIDSGSLCIKQLLPAWLRRLQKARADIHVILDEKSPNFDRLRSGKCDLIIDMVPEIPNGFESVMVAKAQTYLAVPEGHRAAKRKRPRPSDLESATFISYPPGTLHCELQMAGLKTLGLMPEQTLAAPSADSIVSYVSAGLGYSLIPSLSADGFARDGAILAKQSGPGSSFPIHAVWRRNRASNPLLRALLEVAPNQRKSRKSR